MVAQLEERIHQTADEIIDGVIEAGRADFVTDLVAELPLIVIAELLGVPSARPAPGVRLVQPDDRRRGPRVPGHRRPGHRGRHGVVRLRLPSCTRPSASTPTRDLMSVLTQIEVDGEQLIGPGARALLPPAVGGRQRDDPQPDGRAPCRHSSNIRTSGGGCVADRSLLPDGGGGDAALRHPGHELPPPDGRRHGRSATSRSGRTKRWSFSTSPPTGTRRSSTAPQVFDIGRDPNPHIAFGGGGPALLPGGQPGPHGDPGDVRASPGPHARAGPGRPGRAPAVELHQRDQASARSLHSGGVRSTGSSDSTATAAVFAPGDWPRRSSTP